MVKMRGNKAVDKDNSCIKGEMDEDDNVSEMKVCRVCDVNYM